MQAETNAQQQNCAKSRDGFFIDADNVERPLDPSAHVLKMPTFGTKKITKKKHIKNQNPLLLFFKAIAFFFIWLILFPFVYIKFRLRVENKTALKSVKKTGAVIVSNHCHMLDAMLHRLQKKRRFMLTSIPENFKIPVLSTIIKIGDTVPIPRELGALRLFKDIIDEHLQKKYTILFLPERSLWPYYRSLRPFSNGAFRFAYQNNVPILPSCVSIRIKHKKNGKKKYRFTLTYFEPLFVDADLTEREAVELLKQAAFKQMQQRIEIERENDVYVSESDRL